MPAEIIFYNMDGCPYCKRALVLLRELIENGLIEVRPHHHEGAKGANGFPLFVSVKTGKISTGLPRSPEQLLKDLGHSEGSTNQPSRSGGCGGQGYKYHFTVLSADSWCYYSKKMSAQEEGLRNALKPMGICLDFVSDSTDKQRFDALSQQYKAKGFPHVALEHSNGTPIPLPFGGFKVTPDIVEILKTITSERYRYFRPTVERYNNCRPRATVERYNNCRPRATVERYNNCYQYK
jgi:glutaredoxin